MLFDLWDEISGWTEHGMPVTTIAGRLALATLLGLLGCGNVIKLRD